MWGHVPYCTYKYGQYKLDLSFHQILLSPWKWHKLIPCVLYDKYSYLLHQEEHYHMCLEKVKKQGCIKNVHKKYMHIMYFYTNIPCPHKNKNKWKYITLWCGEYCGGNKCFKIFHSKLQYNLYWLGLFP